MKKTFTTVALALVLTFGATFANAGIIISDVAAPACDQTTENKDGIIIFGKDGIIIFGFTVFGSKDDSKCVDKDGIIISDAAGIIISD